MKLKIDPDTFKSWFGQIEVDEDHNHLTIWTPSLFHQDWLSNHYRDEISEIAARINKAPVSVSIQCQLEGGRAKARQAARAGRNSTRRREALPPAAEGLNPLYTFESFVVGASNQFAAAACLAVAESPGRIYNPLFIYGGTGLGKTHLMQAIGYQALRLQPQTKVIYVSAEQFTNEFINSIKDSRTEVFRRKYRGADVLLIDDIHFFAKKEHSQEEFFHTFNEIYDSRRQIVISSDRPAPELAAIEDRLKSRLSWGLSTDIKPPNLETRIAILRKKSDEADIEIPAECLEYIATRIRANIRDLEGALMRISAMAKLQNRVINMVLTQEALHDLTETQRDSRITVDQIQKSVSEYFKVTTQDLKGPRRSSHIALPRQVAMFLCREITKLSLPVIGTEFGGRDHTTVLHSCKKISGLIERDRNMQHVLNDIKSMLRGA